MNDAYQSNKVWIDSVWKKTVDKLEKVAVRSRCKLPSTTIGGVHDDMSVVEPHCWTNGFWGGMMWLLYEATGIEDFRKTAEHSEKLLDKAFEKYELLHHDTGFMWHILSGASYRLTGDERSCNRNLYAASVLASRYNIDGRYIRAWNTDDASGWSIVDCMMNIPQLYWASERIGDSRFARIAMSHADMAAIDHVRKDGSINHIVEHDTETGEFVKAYRGQGCADGSCWTRGLGWAVYGFVLSYIHTKRNKYLETAKLTADYYIDRIKKYNYKTPIDFSQLEEAEYYDSSAGLVVACGLLEISKYVSEPESEKYTDSAIKILKATEQNFCNFDEKDDGLVYMGSIRYPISDNWGLHQNLIYGDFYFVEAMCKLTGRDFLIW